MMKEFGTAVILAGGKSTRMGFDKQLLVKNQEALLTHVFNTLHNLFDDIAVVTNTPSLYYGTRYRTFADEFIGMGPLAGIHAALKHSNSKYVYLLACDMPVLCLEYIKYMRNTIRASEAQICVTRKDNWVEPFNGFYSVDLAEAAEERLRNGNTSVFKFIGSSDTVVIPEKTALSFNPGLTMFTNLNTRAEYEKYLNDV